MTTLTLVTHQRWRIEDLEPYIEVRLDHGLDLTAAGTGDPVWAPGAWAAAAVQAVPDMNLASAGPNWMCEWGTRITGRRITAIRASEVGTLRQVFPLFTKLPETKTDSFEARVREEWELMIDATAVPGDEPIHLQTPVHFDYEVRCWVLDGQVVATAPYFPDRDREEWPSLIDPELDAQAQEWLAGVIEANPDEFPPAVVIDVGRMRQGIGARWAIIEANAAWSADWYTPSDMAAVVDTIIASQRVDPGPWRWTPSPLLVRSSVGLLARGGS